MNAYSNDIIFGTEQKIEDKTMKPKYFSVISNTNDRIFS